ncbi:MAG: YjfB family protein [Chthonomonas sp.]|nr:YjfB family protein [Chthonomonas sp.]
MRIDGANQAAIQALSQTGSSEELRQRLQAAVLKKSLDMQKDQAAELLRQTEGRGQVLDIRV